MKQLFLVSILFVSILFAGFCIPQLFSQTNSSESSSVNRFVTGVVREAASKQSLSGARVMLKGTVIGTIADAEGKFRLQLPANTSSQAVLEIMYIGCKTKIIRLDSFDKQSPEALQNGTSAKEILLDLDPARTDAVIVTAIGIEKAQKTLGYAVSELLGTDLSEARETNLAAALVGKVAGAQINVNTGAVGASSRVILRGVKAIGAYQNNQPLYIVDGIPIDNSSGSQPQKYGGIDWGDGIQHINPDDIATMSILRGASAAALYGSRAQNGVILITTKKGAPHQGLGVEYNGNFVWDTPLVLPDLQNEYGHGYGGGTPSTPDEALDAGTSSWGARMNGQMVMFFDGVRRPLTPQTQNIRDFFQTGHAFTNTVALSGGSEAATMRFSASNLDNVGMIPNSFLNRTTLTLNASAALNERFRLEAKANFITERSNRSPLADLANPGRTFLYMARSMPTELLKKVRTENGDYNAFSYDAYNPNPYFLTTDQFSQQNVERLIVSALARYVFSEEFTLQVRAGRDATLRRNQYIEGVSTPYNPAGGNLRQPNSDARI